MPFTKTPVTPYFYPRPPRGGRRLSKPDDESFKRFLSTPSARRATFQKVWCIVEKAISIHALREEGDRLGLLRRYKMDISIHALREEGDGVRYGVHRRDRHFYPRPPRGGRRSKKLSAGQGPENFYPRPPRGGRPFYSFPQPARLVYFYPRPPRGGRPFWLLLDAVIQVFLSTPSARRATSSPSALHSTSQVFLSTPSARRATLSLGW